MKYLLDTHVFLWSLLEPARLNDHVRAELQNPDNGLWISPISVWEVCLLVEKGRLVLEDVSAEVWIRDALARAPLREAPVNCDVALQSRSLDLAHQDPADRFIAATALAYGLILVTADERLLGSEQVPTLPA